MACNDPGVSTLRQWNEVVQNYVKLNQDLTASAMRSWQPMVDAYTQAWNRLLEPYAALARGACAVPETECPPRCACTVTLRGCPGDTRKATLRVRNTSKEPITYTVAADNFETDCHTIDAQPTVTPNSASAKPGETVTFTAQVQLDSQFQSGRTYRAEVRIAGKYERCVVIAVEVETNCDACCQFDHGDIPQRVKFDPWYRHYQCTEPCFEPVGRQVNPDQPAGTPVGRVVGRVVDKPK